MSTTFRMIDGDIHFDVNGRLDVIEGFDKVSQDIGEILLTNLDTDRDYGSELVLVDSSPVFNISESQVTTYVLDAVERLRTLQRTSQYTTAEEEIAAVEAIEVFKNDQTEITFGLGVLTTSGVAIETGAQLEQRPASFEHLLPPGTDQKSQEFEARARGENVVITGETTNGS